MLAFALTPEQFLETVADFIRRQWTAWLWALVLMAGGGLLAWWRARAQWRRREFLGRLHISLNSLRDGWLLIRTIAEKSVEEVFLNSIAVKIVRAAANRTTESNPLLPLLSDDAWYILNSVLNEVAERFSEGEVRKDMGLPVRTERYVICLTRERAGAMKTQKIRAMVIRKDLLLNLPAQVPQLESPNHITRFQTLKYMAQAYQKQPEQFLELDLSLGAIP
ncbi:MAG: hypothetical protein HY000_23420 [Planctomycetes bacterium]|nr:hypothetical protein [Planctomycetota bacterium]